MVVPACRKHNSDSGRIWSIRRDRSDHSHRPDTASSHASRSRSSIEMDDPDSRPAIADDTVVLDSYTTVYLGYPIWWGNAPRIMSTFVEGHDFEGKTVIPFCTSGGSPIGRSGDNLAAQAGSGNWLQGERLAAGISEDEIQNWIDKLN